jgi:opacity protein-like surface antigen
MTMKRLLAVAAFIAAMVTTAFAADVHEPAKGSAERRAILDAIRPAIEAQMRTPVEFVISVILTDGDWAFVSAMPQHPGGGAIDLEKTAFAGKSDIMDGLSTYALARFANGRWNHVDDIIYQVPKAVIGMEAP